MSSELPSHYPPHAARSQAFSRIVLEAFAAAGRGRDLEVTLAGGPSDSYLTMMRRAAYENAWIAVPRPLTFVKIDQAADWPSGTARKVWETGRAPETVSASGDDHSYVSAPGQTLESGITNEDLLREILRSRAEYDQLRADVQSQLRSVSERVGRLEHGAEPLDGASGET